MAKRLNKLKFDKNQIVFGHTSSILMWNRIKAKNSSTIHTHSISQIYIHHIYIMTNNWTFNDRKITQKRPESIPLI